MRKKVDDLPPASGGRISFDIGGARESEGARERNQSEDVTFLGRQLTIALVSAIVIGGAAGALLRGDSGPPSAHLPNSPTSPAASGCARAAPCPEAPELAGRRLKKNP